MLSIISSRRPIRNFIVYDLEWIPGTLELRLIGVYDENKGYRTYRTIEDFLNYELTSDNRGKWFYAHAGGLADIQFVFESFCRYRNYKVNAYFSGSSAIIVNVTQGKNAWHFVDSYWLLRDKLKNIGEWIGLKKGGVDDKDDPDEIGISDKEYDRRIEIKKEWFRSVSLEILYDYNETDCIILYKAIDAFQQAIRELGGQLQMTLASSAMNLFRRRYLKGNIDTSEGINQMARKSYFASRVEVITRDVNDSLYYDINSSFPFSMTTSCPGAFIKCSNKLPDKKEILHISEVEIEVPSRFISPTPFRFNKRIFFPSGKWRQWLTNVDIDLLQKEGGKILKVFESYWFESFNDLANYSIDLYQKKAKSNSQFERTVYKLLLNSLYGKFAENPIKKSVSIDPDDTSNKIMLMPGVWLEEKKIPIPHVHVPISSHITAMSRQLLYEHMINCKDVHYCDTDGFSTTENLSTGNNIGDLKLEKKISKGYFILPKLYRIEGEVEDKDGLWKKLDYIKAKGFSRMSAERFLKLLEGQTISYERMSRLRENLRNGIIKPKEEEYIKRIKLMDINSINFNPKKHIIPKRFTYPDGYTRPWDIDELMKLL